MLHVEIQFSHEMYRNYMHYARKNLNTKDYLCYRMNAFLIILK